VENLKLYIEMAHGKQASDKLFNEISWLIVHSLKEHSQHPFFSIRRPDTVCVNTVRGKPVSCSTVLGTVRIGSIREQYHWISLKKDLNRYRFLIFDFFIFNI
jgi:hypothetical protein